MKDTFFNYGIESIHIHHKNDKITTDTYRKIYNVIIEKYQKDIDLYFNDLVTAWEEDCKINIVIGPSFSVKVATIMEYEKIPGNNIKLLDVLGEKTDYDMLSLMKKIDNIGCKDKENSKIFVLGLKISWIIEGAFRDMITEKINLYNKANELIQRQLKKEKFL